MKLTQFHSNANFKLYWQLSYSKQKSNIFSHSCTGRIERGNGIPGRYLFERFEYLFLNKKGKEASEEMEDKFLVFPQPAFAHCKGGKTKTDRNKES